MNSYQFQIAIGTLRKEMIEAINKYMPDDKATKAEQKTRKTELIGTLGLLVHDILVKNDFQTVRSSLLISTEKENTVGEVEKKIHSMVGPKNVVSVTELKNSRSSKSNYKVDFKREAIIENGKKEYAVGKFFKNIAKVNKENKGNRLFAGPFIPKSALAASSKLNQLAREIREDSKDKTKLFTRTRIDFVKREVEITIKKEGGTKFVSLTDFNDDDFDQEKWGIKYDQILGENKIKYVPFIPKNVTYVSPLKNKK